jgi:SNF2 family DNA or RNA helicase
VITYRYRYGPGDGPKLLWLEQWLDDNGDEPILVGAVTVPTLDAVVRLLTRKGIDYRLIRGGVPARQREKAKNEFQAGQFRVMLVQQIAGSESITLTRAATSILLDHDLSPITYTQFLGRTARQGQDRECQHYDLAFNLIQQDRILALRRGEDFDAETRRELENVYHQVTQSQSQRRNLAGIPAEYTNHGR